MRNSACRFCATLFFFSSLKWLKWNNNLVLLPSEGAASHLVAEIQQPLWRALPPVGNAVLKAADAANTFYDVLRAKNPSGWRNERNIAGRNRWKEFFFLGLWCKAASYFRQRPCRCEFCCIAHLVLSGSNYSSPEVAVKKTTTSLGRFIVSNFFFTFNFYQRYCYYYYFLLIAIISVVAQWKAHPLPRFAEGVSLKTQAWKSAPCDVTKGTITSGWWPHPQARCCSRPRRPPSFFVLFQTEREKSQQSISFTQEAVNRELNVLVVWWSIRFINHRKLLAGVWMWKNYFCFYFKIFIPFVDQINCWSKSTVPKCKGAARRRRRGWQAFL